MKNKYRPARSAEFHDSRRHEEPARDRARPHVQAHRSPPDPNRGRGVWLYGIHPVLAALANPARRVYRIVISGEAETTLAPRIATLSQSRSGLPRAEILPRDALERLLPRGAVHQGIAVQLEALEELDIDDIVRATDGLDSARVVVLDQVTDPHNVGAIIRSAAAFGTAAVIMPERNSPPSTGTLAKAASGAIEHVPLVRVVNLARALDQLKNAGFWCVGLDATATTALHAADLSGKIAVVLGAEGEGLRRLTREHCDLMVRIPIGRGMESLNVSNAAAIALYELARPK
ncbi:MAG TPA: 23S rRNA (guanosine(2251)-2'-O)-methyltransferase RlmB [Alphaproteobacteria bacterium]|nr:23S rRNA (guanosine(2251)-2'-O)-methyltransferase RlmB [Alphaproteobacteria bacterium]